MSRGFGRNSAPLPGAKPANFKSTLFRLLKYLAPRKKRLITVLIAVIFSTLFTILGPKIMGDTITVVFEGAYAKLQGTSDTGIDFMKVAKMLLFLGSLYLFSSLFTFIQQYLMASVAQRTVYDLRSEIFNKLKRLPLKYYDGHAHGDILSRVINDIDLIGNTLQQSITQFIRSVVLMVGIIVMMLIISPLLTLITVLSLPLSLFVIKPFLKKSQVFFKKQQNELGELNGHIEEMYTGHEVVKAFGQEDSALEKFDEVNEKLYDSGKNAQFISGLMMPFMQFIGNISYVAISIVGGILVTQRTIAIGDIQAFITYSKQFTQPITQTANIANIIQSTVAAAERVFEILDEREEIEDSMGMRLENVKGDVVFDDISFGYDSTALMSHLSIDAKSGETIAIVGPTGAGKTTLINLLMRFYDVDAGTIKIDGKDIRTISRQSLRRTFGMVLQETWLFHGTIKENIKYGKPNATDDEVYRVAKAAYADHFIRTLPEGYETILNEEGSNISQGQKQLITIARAMLANPQIMILDEATSSVDTRTELAIQKAMDNLMADKTSFVIAHRLSTIKDADRILVMDQGTVIEQGTHASLIEANGFYAELYYSQFSKQKVS